MTDWHMTGSRKAGMDPTLPALVERLRAATQAFDELHDAVDSATPWALSAVFGAEPEAVWGPLELLAHVAEMLRYWLGEVERILDQSATEAEPVPFGRLEMDPLRLAIIERDRTLPLRELYARITAESERIAARLTDLSPEEGRRRGTHPRYGETDVTAVVERHIIDHLERHVAQLREILAARRT
jgi:hypothetical protein